MEAVTSYGIYFIIYDNDKTQWQALANQVGWQPIYYHAPPNPNLNERQWLAHQACAARATQLQQQWILIADQPFAVSLIKDIQQLFSYMLIHWEEWDIIPLIRLIPGQVYFIHPLVAAQLTQTPPSNITLNQWLRQHRVITQNYIKSGIKEYTDVTVDNDYYLSIVAIVIIIVLIIIFSVWRCKS